MRPAGTGVNQMPIAIANGAARFRSNLGAIIWQASRGRLAGPNATLQLDGAPLDRTVLRLPITNCQENS